ncbi:hypothetical protein F4814DRAFT_447980 [Daldinia grandis]|nr:hypothetical protein F4814DRAFT_447980 [Daldinia grandis]
MRLNCSNVDILCSPGQRDQNGWETRTAEGQRAGPRVFETTRTESTSRTRDLSDLQSFSMPKSSSVRTIRLLFDGTRLLFDSVQLTIMLLYDIRTNLPIADIAIAALLVLWDLSEKVYLKNDSPCIISDMSSIIIEVAIPVGIVVLMYFVILDLKTEYGQLSDSSSGYSQGWLDTGTYYNISFQIPVVLLWVPVVILSGILVYHMVISYTRRYDRKIRPIIVFTRTGDPVAVIPRARPSNDSASRVSIDSLIQTSEEPGLQEVRVL